jgi:hypothetical protein
MPPYRRYAYARQDERQLLGTSNLCATGLGRSPTKVNSDACIASSKSNGFACLDEPDTFLRKDALDVSG